MWNRFKTLDPLLYVIPVLFIATSVTVIYGLTNDTVGSSLAVHQGVYGLIGLVGMFFLTFIDYRSLRSWAVWLYLVGIVALIGVQFFGVEVFGATRWIDLGFIQFQPGELEKAIIILSLAALVGKNSQIVSHRRFFFALLIAAVPVVAILLQPDLGTALVVFVTTVVMLLHARIQRLHWLIVLLGVTAVVGVIFLSFKEVAPFNKVLKDYQKERLVSFIDPKSDPSGSGYNVSQSKIAVGSGGLTGKSLGFGSQSQLHFLPVAHADFIFAGIAEAWGLIGAYGIIILFAILILRIMNAARIAKDSFGMLICVGIMAKLLFEVLVNIGMNVGIMPVTGIPLPFLSYGGTTLITNLLLIGIAQSIVIRYKRLTF